METQLFHPYQELAFQIFPALQNDQLTEEQWQMVEEELKTALGIIPQREQLCIRLRFGIDNNESPGPMSLRAVGKHIPRADSDRTGISPASVLGLISMGCAGMRNYMRIPHEEENPQSRFMYCLLNRPRIAKAE